MRLRLFVAAALIGVAQSQDDEGFKSERVNFQPPTTPNPATTLLVDTFQSDELDGWTNLSSNKFSGEWKQTTRQADNIKGDKGLLMTSPSSYHGLAKSLSREHDVRKEPIFATMEVQQENPVNCGGAYFKLFHTEKTSGKEVASFDEHTPYSIMFGPDKCGYLTNRVHLIVKYPTPDIAIDEEEDTHEAHFDNSPRVGDGVATHQYGFGVYPDGQVKIWVDGKDVKSGDFKEVFKKDAWGNPEEIDDPEDSRPDDWIDDPMMPDPEAEKPEDWDEDAPEFVNDEDAEMPEGWKEDAPQYIENPDAEKPEDWNDEEDGEWFPPKMRNPECYVGCGKWTPPVKPNPEYKGKWEPPLVENPEYKGAWAPRKMANPQHWSINNPMDVIQPFNAIGFELWTVDAGYMFDNIFITSSESDFLQFIKETYQFKAPIEARNIEIAKQIEKEENSDTPNLLKQESGFTNKNIVIMGGAVMAVTGLTAFLRRLRTRQATVVEEAVHKKEDDNKKPEESDEKAPSAEDVESDEDKSAPTSATDKTGVKQRMTRKNSSQKASE